MWLATDRFQTFGGSHQTALAVLVVGAVALVAVSRVSPGRAEGLGRGLAVAIVVVTAPLQVLYLTPGYWDLGKS
ncbi:MAG: hypothetical protein ACRCYQ_07185, partial [Nocardioides sp.]